MKEVKGYEGLYAVTENGQVWSYKRNKFLKPWVCQGGYLQVSLTKNKIAKKHKVQRLGAIAVIDNPDNLPQVNHKDENKTNNSVENLEWCDAKYNINYGTRTERAKRKREEILNNGFTKSVNSND